MHAATVSHHNSGHKHANNNALLYLPHTCLLICFPLLCTIFWSIAFEKCSTWPTNSELMPYQPPFSTATTATPIFLKQLWLRLPLKITQRALDKLSTLTEGILLPEIFMKWQKPCLTYLCHKKVVNTDQVAMIAYGMDNPFLNKSYLGNTSEITMVTFMEYMTMSHALWTPHNWKQQVGCKVTNCNQGNSKLMHWVIKLQAKKNAFLSQASNQPPLGFGGPILGHSSCQNS